MKNILTNTLLILTFGVMLIGCMSEKKLAKKCMEKFPIQEHTTVTIKEHTDTFYVEGQPIVINCDSVIEWLDNPIVTVPCPPVRTVVKTVTKDSIVKEVDTRQVYLLTTENNELKADVIGKDKEIVSMKDKRDDWRFRFWVLASIVAAYIIIRLFGGYLKGFVRP